MLFLLEVGFAPAWGAPAHPASRQLSASAIAFALFPDHSCFYPGKQKTIPNLGTVFVLLYLAPMVVLALARKRRAAGERSARLTMAAPNCR